MANPIEDALSSILPDQTRSFFFGNAPPESPLSYQSLLTRRKIAEQLMAKRSPFPKNLGEGIASIGEAIGDRRALSQLDTANAGQEADTNTRVQGLPPSDYLPPPPIAPAAVPPVRTSDATPSATSPDMAPPLAYADASGSPAATPAPINTAPDSTIGMGSAAPGVPLPPPRPVYDRSKQNAEIQADPALADRIRLMAAGEVGSNPSLQQIQIESALNRAKTQGIPVAQALETYTGRGSRGYYPPQTFLRGMAGQDPLTAAMRGSDLGGQTLGFSPTGNASGGVASRGIASGRYGDARAIGTGPGAETYVTQDSPSHLARLQATRVPQNFPDSGPVASATPDQGATGDGSALAFSGQPVASNAQDAITQALLRQSTPTLPGDVMSGRPQPGGAVMSNAAAPLPPDVMAGAPQVAGDIQPNFVPGAGALPFSGNPPTVTPDIVPAGARPPVQMAAAANGNPPIPTSIPPAPQPSPADLYKPPSRVAPTPPAERPILAREAQGNQMIMQGLTTGNPQLLAIGQQVVAQEKALRDNLYKLDVEKYTKDYSDYVAKNMLDEQKRYSAPADAADLRKKIYEGPPQAVPPGLGSAGAPVASAPGQAPQLALAGSGTPPGQTALPPSYNPLLGTPQSPQRIGRPIPEPNPGVPQSEWDKLQEPIMLKKMEAAKTVQQPFQETLDLLNQARNHPERNLGVGIFSSAAQGPGGPAAGFGAIMRQLQGKNFLQGFSALKDTGANARFTQLEAQKTEDAQARLMTAQNKGDFDKALNDFEDHLRTGLETAQRQVNQPVTAYRTGNDNYSYAPDIGQLGRRGPDRKIMEYIGGNPARDSSYKLPGQ